MGNKCVNKPQLKGLCVNPKYRSYYWTQQCAEALSAECSTITRPLNAHCPH